MIDVDRETLISLPAAAPTVPPSGISTPTIYRWGLRGVRGIRLETICIGGQRYTSQDAIRRFFDAQTREADSRLAAVQAEAAVKQLRPRPEALAAAASLKAKGY